MAGPTLALYRRYRPETFADVIGQEHVTGPLMQALRSGRVNHAYLFSGPRGCGKTTSARILARCLNCAGPDGAATGPTDTPCGVCPSCVELARGGSGSLDVVEIDAASHGGVDDARELRERATFAPARDRYKVFVIDEAHMVSPQGFNALLKLVEEPPEHVMFVFATTEPDKVLATIRSRTHHYPFHLVPPETLLRHLEQLCEVEGVPVGKGVLPLVVRAGAGSVRDSLSVLDQLIAGADEGGIDYERAIALLGYTHASLLDDVVDALAAGDGGSVFRVVDRVIESGHDPRRFVEDLLERLRDLVVVRAVGESASSVLRGVPDDQLARMQGQAQLLGAAELSRAADVANAALTEMVGATSPRLHLELLCARLLLPVADAGERGLGARLDRIERRLGVPSTGPVGVAAPAPAGPPAVATPAAAPRAPAERAAASPEPGPGPGPGPGESAAASVSSERGEPAEVTASLEPDQAATAPATAEPARPAAAQEPRPAAAQERGVAPGADVDTVRRMWPDVLERIASLRRSTWSLVSSHAQVHEVTATAVRLSFSSEGLATAFRGGSHADVVRQALGDVIGVGLPVEPVVGGAPAQPEARQPSRGQRQPEGRRPEGRSQPESRQAEGRQPESRQPEGRRQEGRRPEPAGTARPQAAHEVDPVGPDAGPPDERTSPTSSTDWPEPVAPGRGARRPGAPAGERAPEPPDQPGPADPAPEQAGSGAGTDDGAGRTAPRRTQPERGETAGSRSAEPSAGSSGSPAAARRPSRAGRSSTGTGEDPPRDASPAPPPGWDDVPPPTEPPGEVDGPPDPRELDRPSRTASTGAAAARAAALASRGRGDQRGGVTTSAGTAPSPVSSTSGSPVPEVEDEPSRDDEDAEDQGLVGERLVAQVLGGRVIDDASR